MVRKLAKELNYVESMNLCLMIQKEYAEKKLSDSAFAEYAGEKLGLELSAAFVYARRNALGIPPSKIIKGIEKREREASTRKIDSPPPIYKRVQELERHVQILETKLADLLND